MKKNLLFAISVFLITIVGLLVFTEASKKPVKDTSKIESVEQSTEESKFVSANFK